MRRTLIVLAAFGLMLGGAGVASALNLHSPSDHPWVRPATGKLVDASGSESGCEVALSVAIDTARIQQVLVCDQAWQHGRLTLTRQRITPDGQRMPKTVMNNGRWRDVRAGSTGEGAQMGFDWACETDAFYETYVLSLRAKVRSSETDTNPYIGTVETLIYNDCRA